MSLHEYPEVIQGTDEWHDQRRGMVTASTVGQLISVGAPGAASVDCPTCKAEVDSPCISAARKTPTPIKTFHDPRTANASALPPTYSVADNDTSRALTALLVAERITGHTDPTYFNDDMLRGTLEEPRARDVYSEHYAPVTETGFLVRDDWGFRIGYSPDGLVGDDGLIEVKAPRTKTHVRTVLADEVPAQHMPQLQTGLLVSGREWIDFIPYSGGLPMWKKRVYPDQRWFDAIIAAVAQFEATAEQMISDYLTKVDGLPATERIDHNDLGLVF